MNCQFQRTGDTLRCRVCGRSVKTKSSVPVRAACGARRTPAPRVRPGPGTQLKRLLAGWPFYIKTTSGCSCNRHATQMDEWGCDECGRRIDQIVGWLRQEAEKRGLPFFDAVGRALVKRAISRAREAEKASVPPK